jgi:CitB family two-component system response regulator MalR
MTKVLLVDDDKSVQKLVGTLLEQEYGFEVLSAYNRKEGLIRLIENSDIDMILLDNYMPSREDGWEMYKEIQNNDEYEKYRNIPIISIGEFSDEQKKYFTNSIDKPLGFSELEEVIQNALS